jgi:hypothetical protein
MITRRRALGMTMASGALLSAQDLPGGFKLWGNYMDKGVQIGIVEETNAFSVLVHQTSKDVDEATVTVFYESRVPQLDSPVLLSQESQCPAFAGINGGTNKNFTCPLDKVKFIRVTLLKRVSQSEFRP